MDTLTPGTRLGEYEIGSVLGAGGMGVVYRARDVRLGRDVAIKILLPDVAGNPDRLRRFRREAQVLASINHPNIAAIYGIEDAPASLPGPFLVMELVDGPTLRDVIIGSRALPMAKALPIALQICEALRAAHERGVMHRDLKPENVKVRPDGVVKVLDFGLAKAMDVTASSYETVEPTRAGTIVGTAAYMSPEQARGLEVDQRTDIWAFGCVLYEMLTGRRAFDGATFSDSLAAVIEREPDWSLLPLTLAPHIARLLRRCLAKDPRKRIAAASDVQLDLEDAGTSVSGAAATPVVTISSGPRGLLAVAVIIAAFALGWWTGHRAPATGPAALTRTIVTVNPALKLRGANPFEQFPFARDRPSRLAIALSPDGRMLAFTGMKDGVVRLYLRNLDAVEAKAVDDTDGADGVVFSPDGAWVAFWSKGAIRKVAVAGGPPVKICDTTEPFGISWSPDDQIVFGGGTIRSVAATGGQVTELTKLEPGERTHVLPQVPPGGKWLLFTVLPAVNDWEHTRVVAQSMASGERHMLLEGATDARYAETGHLLFMRFGRLMAAPFDVDRAVLAGGEAGMIDDVMQAANTTAIQLDTGVGQYALSSTGTLAYVNGGAVPDALNTMAWVNRDGSKEPIVAPVRPYFSPRLSPDGKHIAVGTVGADQQSLWRYDFADGSMLRLTTEGHVEQPIWTPDGQTITFGLSQQGPYNLFSVRADGSAPPVRLTTGNGMQFADSWTPDGQQLIMNEGGRILVFDRRDGAAPTALSDAKFPERMADLSPDGHWLAYVSSETGRSEVFVRAYPGLGSKRQVSTDGGTEPAWSRDGRKLVFPVNQPAPNADKARFFEVDVTRAGDTLTLSRPRFVLETFFDGATIARSWDMTPDARRFLIVQEGYSPAVTAAREINFVQGWSEELKAKTSGRKNP